MTEEDPLSLPLDKGEKYSPSLTRRGQG